MNIPGDLKYTNDHEWGKPEGSKLRVGISDYAQKELGDIVYIELKGPGSMVKKGETVGTIESVKAVSDLYAPVSGAVLEVNGKLSDSPELVNQDCYGAAWMLLLEMDDPTELEGLMDASAYEEFLRAEAK